MPLGIRVLRGPDWDQNEADGGEGHLGTVVGFKAEEGTAEVVWDNGQVTTCRVGKEGKHDLRIYDNATTGVIHPDVTCAGCLSSCIRGLRWRCSLCPNLHLCSRCYVIGVHDVKHPFLQFTLPKDEGVTVGRRSDVTRVRLQGLFLGARVVRGPDWQSGDADGGPGGRGVVIELVSPNGGSTTNMVRVGWDSGQSLQHRLGLHGKVDLVCTEEAPGPPCYVSHLPVLDVSHFRYVPETPNSASAQKEIGREFDPLKSKEDDSQVTQGKVPGTQAPPAAVRFKIGDTVRIVSDLALLKRQQELHADWPEGMEKAAGKVGTVKNVNITGNLLVVFGQKSLVFSPESCIPAHGCATDFIESEQFLFPMESLQGIHRLAADFCGGDLFKMFGGLLGDFEGSVRLTGLLGAVAVGDTNTAANFIDENPELVRETVAGTTALHYAVLNGQEASVRLLVAKGSDVNHGNDLGLRPLHTSVFLQNTPLTKLLLELGADANLSNVKSQTPLHLAIALNCLDIVRVLIKHGADVNKQDDGGQTAMYIALGKDDINPSILDALLAVDTLDFTLTTGQNATILHAAVHFSKPRELEKILARDSSMLNQKMDEGFTPLHVAAWNNHKEAVNILLRAHADVEAREEKEQTPLHLACARDHSECTRILLETGGAEVNAANRDGNTPLHLYISNWLNTGQENARDEGLELAKYLIHHGAWIDAPNNNGKTPLDLAPDHVVDKLKRFIQDGCKLPQKHETLQELSNESTASSLATASVKCVTCHQREADVTFLPCSHKVVCRQCAEGAQSCRDCGKDIEKTVDAEGKTLLPTDAAPPSQAEVAQAEVEECKVQ